MAERRVAALADIPDQGMRLVEIDGTKIVLVRLGSEVHALAGECPHAGAPLHEGAICNGRLICPWHSGTFEIATGALVEPPPMTPLARFACRVAGADVLLDPTPIPPPAPAQRDPADGRNFLLIGSGAASAMAAFSLREFGFTGRIVMIGPHPEEPLDRTLLSKQAMAGEDWAKDALPLLSAEQARTFGIERIDARVTALDAAAKRATLGDGSTLGYDAALLATGGIPKRLSVPGGDLEGVFTLRHQPDMEGIITASEATARVLVIGTSFIGMEVAGALTQRGCRVVVAGPEALPFEAQFGPDLARALLRAHEENGVAFHLGRNIVRLEGQGRVAAAILDNGERIEAGAVVVGIGVTPATGFVSGVRQGGGRRHPGRCASLRAADGLFAAGDIAALPGPDGKPRRIEHWRVAEQHGRAAARAMLGHAAPFDGVPFFWTAQHDKVVDYIGHAREWDEIAVDGDVPGFDFLSFYLKGGRIAAIATAGRDRQTAMLSN